MSIKKDVERLLYLLPAPEEPTSQDLVEARKNLRKCAASRLRRKTEELEDLLIHEREMRA